MKQISLLLAITFSLTFKSYGQEVNITTATIEYGIYVWDTESDGHWEQTKPLEKIVSKFIINKTDSTVIHILGESRSVYDITDYEFIKDKNRWELGLISESRNFYYGIIDNEKENLRILYEDGDTVRLVRYAFKKIWKSKPEN
jgi:hypothetical protein